MKQSLSDNSIEGAPDWSATKEKVDPIYYDEYVEYMVALVRIFKEEIGVEPTGICPQNEPAFTEPYGSAILDPTHMATVCGMLGKRLNDEGYTTKVINSEQVFNQGYKPVLEYINAVKADPLANQYTKVIGTHVPFNNPTLLASQQAACNSGTYKRELWNTEAHEVGNDFNAVIFESDAVIGCMNYGYTTWTYLTFSVNSIGDDNDPTIKSGMVYGSKPTKHYYAYKNFTKYIRKGAVQLKSTSSSSMINTIAYYNEGDTTMTMVLLNKDTKNPLAVRLSGSAPSGGWKAYRTTLYEKCEEVSPFKDGLLCLPPRSITTIVVKTNINHAPSADPVADVKLDKNSGTAVTITGIGCGDPVAQAMTVTASCSDIAILEQPTVTYNSITNKATLLLKPVTDATGTVTVTVIIKDDGGRANGGIDADTIKFNVSIQTNSLNDLSDKVTLYPNPASDFINLTLPSGLMNADLTIINTVGQVVSAHKIINGNSVGLDVSQLPSGVYLISLNGVSGTARLNFIKK